MSDMENENDGETESETELGLPLFRPFTRSNYEQNKRKDGRNHLSKKPICLEGI